MALQEILELERARESDLQFFVTQPQLLEAFSVLKAITAADPNRAFIPELPSNSVILVKLGAEQTARR